MSYHVGYPTPEGWCDAYEGDDFERALRTATLPNHELLDRETGEWWDPLSIHDALVLDYGDACTYHGCPVHDAAAPSRQGERS